MSIKCICFDFDGTLISLVETHYEALNKAIESIAGSEFTISREEQNTFYNGLSTKVKLNHLHKIKGLPKYFIDEINIEKQNHTVSAIRNNITANSTLRHDLLKLKSEGYIIQCASNAMLNTVQVGLRQLDIIDCFDFIIGNDLVKNQKPASEIYLKCFIEAGINPQECLIVEDSYHGRVGAKSSGAHLCTVDNETQTTYEHIKNCIDKVNTKMKKHSWSCSRLNILIPMSGAGSRFAQAGYQLPKPLIDVAGKPMIQRVVENINVDANYIFVIQEEHDIKYNLSTLLQLIVPHCKVVKTSGLTEGAACTTLLARKYIDNDEHLLIANADQFIPNFDSVAFFNSQLQSNTDGNIITFHRENDKKWSYVKVDENGFATEVAEKNPISDKASIGFYYFNKGSDYVKSAEDMINAGDKTNNEYYICPCYNYLIKADKKITTYHIDNFYGLGTPDDLNLFLKEYSDKL